MRLMWTVYILTGYLITVSCFKCINDIRSISSTQIFNLNDPLASLEENTRIMLKEEAASPLRKLRRFVYIVMFSGGGLGTFFALPQFIKASSSATDLTNPTTNLLIDVGAVLLAAFLWNRETISYEKKFEEFRLKEKKTTSKLTTVDKIEKEQRLALLPVEIQASQRNVNETRIVSLGDLQIKGNQNVVIVAGKLNFVKDAIISARIEGNELFNSMETIVIPVVLNDDQLTSEPKSKKGFGQSKELGLMEAPYIAKPAQVNVWQSYLDEEVGLAKQQGAKDALTTGIVLAIHKNGQVVRRGVGMPPWKQVVDEVTKAKVVT